MGVNVNTQFNTQSTPTSKTSSVVSASTPNMDRLIKLSISTQQVVSYFGQMILLNYQADLDDVCGPKPTLYRAIPYKQEIGKDITTQIDAYASKCL